MVLIKKYKGGVKKGNGNVSHNEYFVKNIKSTF